ncbi:MAG: universal stress protein [Nitrososphaerota archaeon]|nr:universal stress protein [Nitrososphaerota archaeon]
MAFNLGKILVAVDGSENSDYALNIAVKIAEKYSSRIVLLHVKSPSAAVVAVQGPIMDPILGTSPILVPSTAGEKPRESVDLLETRKALVAERNIAVSTELVESVDIGGEILKRSLSGGYDLIVLGSRGLGGLRSFFLGSVSVKVAKEAKCSVLVMKNKIETIPKIILGYDGSEDSKKALQCAKDLAQKFRARLSILSVINIPVSGDGYVLSSVDKWEKEAKQLVDETVSAMKLEGIDVAGKVTEYTDISRAIADEAERGGYNIIVVGSRGRGRLRSLFLGSVASGVANASKTNVFIVR